MNAADRQAPLAPLTSLRFIAALLVLLSHLIFLEHSGSPFLAALYGLFFKQGACGVSFFFILSGFILTHAYERSLLDGRIAARTYFHRRLARIFPLHLIVGLAFLSWLAVRGDMPPLAAVLLNLSLLHGWFPDPILHYSLNGPSWSLSDELFFYALFPLLVRLSRMALRRLFICGLCAVSIAACLAAMMVEGYSPRVDWLLYVFPITRLVEFIAGMLLYRAWRDGVGRRWAGSGAEVALTLVLAAVMVAVEWFAVPLALRYQLLFLPPMAALILIFAHGQGRLSGLLRQRRLQWLGEASFALYLIHRPMISFMERWSGRGVASDAALAIAMLTLAVMAAIATFWLVDQPIQRWLRRGVFRLSASKKEGRSEDRPLKVLGEDA